MSLPTLPDHQLVAFARADDFFFGLLHSRFHEIWALAQGTQLREKESGFRYTPTTCFETFPFPRPTPAQEAAVATAAKELNELRERWLNPPEWTVEKLLEFPGSANSPWARYVVNPDKNGIGTVLCAACLLAVGLPTDLAMEESVTRRMTHPALDASDRRKARR